MRILFLSNAASIHTVRWVNALSERGHEVHLVYKSDDTPTDNKINENIMQHRLKYSGTKGYFFNAMQLRKLAKEINPVVINAHYASGYGTLVRLARLSPLVLSVWGSDVYDFPYKSKFKLKLLIDNLRYANVIASTSESMAEQVKLLLDDDTKSVYITPFGVDLSKYNNRKVKNSDKILIGNVKSLKEIYGLEYLIRAIAILRCNLETNNRIDLSEKISAVIYGDGVLREKLELLTKELGLQDIVIFGNKIPNCEVPKVLKEFDIFCATSNQESFGVSIVEAMAMSLPVVATDVSGFKEVVTDGETGIIVERKNPEEIAEALGKLISNEKLRREFGNKGRKKVEELYSWDDNVSTMIGIYESLSKMTKLECKV